MKQRAEVQRPMTIEESSLRHLAYLGVLKYMAPGIARDLDYSALPDSRSQPTPARLHPEIDAGIDAMLDELAKKLRVTNPVAALSSVSENLDQRVLRDTLPNADIAETPAEHAFFSAKSETPFGERPEIALLFQLTINTELGKEAQHANALRYLSREFRVERSDVKVVDREQRIYRVNPHIYSDHKLEGLYSRTTFVLELPVETGKIRAKSVEDGTIVYIERPGRLSGLRVTSNILAMIPSHTNGDTAAVTSALSRELSPVAVHLRNGQKPVLLYRQLGDSESDARAMDATHASYQQALAPHQDKVSILPTAMFGPKGVPYHTALKTWMAPSVERV